MQVRSMSGISSSCSSILACLSRSVDNAVSSCRSRCKPIGVFQLSHPTRRRLLSKNELRAPSRFGLMLGMLGSHILEMFSRCTPFAITTSFSSSFSSSACPSHAWQMYNHTSVQAFEIPFACRYDVWRNLVHNVIQIPNAEPPYITPCAMLENRPTRKKKSVGKAPGCRGTLQSAVQPRVTVLL